MQCPSGLETKIISQHRCGLLHTSWLQCREHCRAPLAYQYRGSLSIPGSLLHGLYPPLVCLHHSAFQTTLPDTHFSSRLTALAALTCRTNFPSARTPTHPHTRTKICQAHLSPDLLQPQLFHPRVLPEHRSPGWPRWASSRAPDAPRSHVARRKVQNHPGNIASDLGAWGCGGETLPRCAA